MPSAIVISTAVASALGFLLNASVLYVVFTRRSRPHHLLFAAILLVCALWDSGVFLAMVRNSHLAELPIYGYIVTVPCIFLPALVFHFTQSYLGLSHTWAVRTIWAVSFVTAAAQASGILWPVQGVYQYPWGNIFRMAAPPIAAAVPLAFFSSVFGASCWLLSRAYREDPRTLAARHSLYILLGFAAMTLAMPKLLPVYGINFPAYLPLGMILNDVFAFIIGFAIVKERLFDITLIVKRSALYSVLAAVAIFVFSLSEHTLAAYLGNLIGEKSRMPEFVSVAVAIAVLLPLYRRLEHTLDVYFAKRRIDF